MHLSSARDRQRCTGPCPHRSDGFSLVEVMVALVICSVGLLGLAKMESLALSSTGVAGSRSLAAIEAASLAAAMHANPGYWAVGTAPVSTTVNAATAATSPTACTAAGACTSATAVATYDLQQWAVALSQVLPNYLGTITCAPATLPVTCTIQIQWAENAVAANSQQTNMAALQTVAQAPTYVLYVQP